MNWPLAVSPFTIAENFELAKQYYLAEDWLVEHHPKLMEELSL